MIFDTHAHYDDEQFDGDRDELLKSMPDLGVGTIVDVSATYESCEKVLALAGKYPHVYAAIGVHPDEVGELNEDKIQHMLIDQKVLSKFFLKIKIIFLQNLNGILRISKCRCFHLLFS